MRKKILYFSISGFLLWLSLSAAVFDDPIALTFSDFKSPSDSTSQEKVHLHLDKPYYVAGDHIWFKAYVLEEHSLAPSTISSVLYVDLIKNNTAVKTLKLPLENGIAWGDFKLSDSIPGGNYRIRAYTQWMRNAPEAFFFDKDIVIGNRSMPSEVEKPPVPKDLDVRFFPEGGQMVKGIPTKVAVRAMNKDGSGEKINGKVTLQNGESISFATNDLGLGYFIINAASSEPPKAIITFKNGARKEYDLPKIQDSGYSLGMKENGVLQIYMSADRLNTGTLTLVGQRNGNVYFKQGIPTGRQMASITIPTDRLPSGILQLSLLGTDGAPLSERFIFINHEHDKLELNIVGLKESYSKRSPVELFIDAKQQGADVKGSFSVSVTNANIIHPDIENEANILSSFLLNSDAKVIIDKPNRYLGTNAKSDIDLLMMTGTWRHIPWRSRNEKPTFEPERTMGITGTLTNNGKPVANGKVTLVKSSGGFDMLSTTSDEKGRFRFDSLSFGDSTKLLVQARTAGDKKNVRILIDQVPGQKIARREVPLAWEKDMGEQLKNYDRLTEEYYKEQAKHIMVKGTNQLKQVEITAGRNLRENYVRLHGKADQEFSSKELDSAGFLSQVLLGKVRGNYRNYAVMLDGVFLTGLELTHFFAATEPSSLERIEALNSSYALALYRSLSPILIVTSKRFPLAVKYAPGVTTISPKGFSYSSAFQSPDYSTSSDGRPDLRPTVYWNPNLATDENGKLHIKYFNTDQPGKYRMVIEGIGGNRGLARKEIYYEVK